MLAFLLGQIAKSSRGFFLQSSSFCALSAFRDLPIHHFFFQSSAAPNICGENRWTKKTNLVAKHKMHPSLRHPPLTSPAPPHPTIACPLSPHPNKQSITKVNRFGHAKPKMRSAPLITRSASPPPSPANPRHPFLPPLPPPPLSSTPTLFPPPPDQIQKSKTRVFAFPKKTRDGHTDGRTDRPSYRDARMHLKSSSVFPSLEQMRYRWTGRCI